MEKKRELTKNFWITWILIFLFLIIASAVGFGLFSYREEEVIVNDENGGDVVLNYSSDFPGIIIKNAVPTTDAVGMKKMEDGDYFDFSVETILDNARSVEYELSLVKDKKLSNIPDDDIRIYLEKENSGTYSAVFEPKGFTPLKKDSKYGSKTGDMVLTKEKKTRKSTDLYRLRIWLRDQSTVVNGNYSVEVVVSGISK
jgi:hypothetical protein